MFQKFANMAASGKQFSCPLGMGGKQELFGMTDSNSGGEGDGQKHWSKKFVKIIQNNTIFILPC